MRGAEAPEKEGGARANISKVSGVCTAAGTREIPHALLLLSPSFLRVVYFCPYIQDAGASRCHEYVWTRLQSSYSPLTPQQTRKPQAGSGSSAARLSYPTSQQQRPSLTSFDHVLAPRPC